MTDGYAGCPSTLMNRGRRCPTRHKVSCRKCLAAIRSRWGESMNSMVLLS